MRRKEFIDKILDSISDTFDIYHNYWFDKTKYVIYAYHYSNNGKFDSASDAMLYNAKEYEHMFFINSDNLSMEQFDNLLSLATDKLEPHFVRGDNKLPCKEHMCSYITFVIITRNKPGADVIKKIEECNWTLKYKLGLRGYSRLRIICATPREYSVICNKYGGRVAEYLTSLMLNMEKFSYEDD